MSGLSRNAIRVLQARYLRKNTSGKVVETPGQMFKRVARNVAQAESKYGSAKRQREIERQFEQTLARRDFLPNTPTLANAGNRLQQLSACYVVPVGDSLESIFEAVKLQAVIHQSGGGTGFDFTQLRPRGDVVKSTMRSASGPVSFMRVFDQVTEAIKQGGIRRGANMGILNVSHPDVMEFITAKSDMKSLTNFNISVTVTERFMKAVERNAKWKLINPRSGKATRVVKAREIWDKLVHEAWRNGDPGVIFIDEVNRHNPTSAIGKITATNPCGEVPLLPFEPCNLGSINVANFYDASANDVKWEELGETAKLGVRFLDDVIDMNKYPHLEIERMAKGNRKIGLGVMGFAQLLFKLGIKYDSEEGAAFGERLMRFISEKANEASEELARERGTFPFWSKSVYARQGRKLRNATRTCIAPTGSISMIADCSSGIEPVFALSFVKRVLGGEELAYVDPVFEEAAKQAGIYNQKLMKQVAMEGSVARMTGIPRQMKEIFVTSHDITPYWHVRMQAAFQKHTDLAVSKTVNFPASATVRDVEEAYWLAFKMKCKGITIYRDGSREFQVLAVKKPTREIVVKETHWLEKKVMKCPKCGGHIRFQEGCGNCMQCGTSLCTV